jgi:hypothetical protein
MARCPECDRELEPKPTGRFKVLCWPTHDAKPITTNSLTLNEWNQHRADHRMSNRSGQVDRCILSGQPVD